MTNWDNAYIKYPTKLQPTDEDKANLPVAITEWFIANDQGDRVRFTRLHNDCIWNIDPKALWIYLQDNQVVKEDTLWEVIPHIEKVENFNLYTGEAQLNGKDIHWNPTLQLWKYCNYRTVHFNKTPTEGTNLELKSNKELNDNLSNKSDQDEDTAQVKNILRRAETTLIQSLEKIVSRTRTPNPSNPPS